MKIKIISNPKKQWTKKLAKKIKSFLGTGSHQVVARGADATICIGGDGTILYANHQKRLDGVVLGVGTEKSYICQLRRNSWKHYILKLLEKKKMIKIMTLNCVIGKKRFNALNDFVIHATHYRVAELDVTINSKTISFEGDGMILASPLGSAAYAYSAGGKKLRPRERKISIVPICPYKRAFSPKVLPEKGKINIKVGSDCAFILDGIFIRKLRKGEHAIIEKGRDLMFFQGVGNDDF